MMNERQCCYEYMKGKPYFVSLINPSCVVSIKCVNIACIEALKMLVNFGSPNTLKIILITFSFQHFENCELCIALQLNTFAL